MFKILSRRYVIEDRYIVLPDGEEVLLGTATLDNDEALAISDTEDSPEFSKLADLIEFDELYNVAITEKGDTGRLSEIEKEFR